MALFKILRGGFQDSPTNITDGWAYFTPDNKGFYIDVIGDVGGFTYNDRIQINEKVRKESLMLYASGWGSSTYSLAIDEQFTNEHYIVHVEPSLLGSVDENYVIAAAVTKANMSYILDGENHRLFFIANGVQPTVDIPVVVEFIPKEVKYINFSIAGFNYSLTTFIAMEGMTWG